MARVVLCLLVLDKIVNLLIRLSAHALISETGHCSYYLHELLVSDLTIDFHASLVAQLFVLSVVFLLLVDLMKLDLEH